MTFAVVHILNTIESLKNEPHEKHGLSKRADWYTAPFATDEQWKKAQCKGSWFVQVMPLSDIAAGARCQPPIASIQSPWWGDLKQSLYTWGYQEMPLEEEDGDYTERIYGKYWGQAMHQLGIGTRAWVDNWVYCFTHGNNQIRDEYGQPIPLREQVYEVAGHEYPATGGYAKFAVNAAGGAIFVRQVLSPGVAFQYLFGHNSNPAELPALRAISDILWSGWYRGSQPLAGPNPNVANVKYLFSLWVTNTESIGILKRALASRGKTQPSVWPGDDFDMSTSEGQAILGSPNGKLFGYFISQRKQDIGVRCIYNARVFIGDYGDLPTILFFVAGGSAIDTKQGEILPAVDIA